MKEDIDFLAERLKAQSDTTGREIIKRLIEFNSMPVTLETAWQVIHFSGAVLADLKEPNSRVPVVGDKVRWTWCLVPNEDGRLTPKTMDGEVIAVYGPSDNPITVDTISKLGRTAHRWWDLEILQS